MYFFLHWPQLLLIALELICVLLISSSIPLKILLCLLIGEMGNSLIFMVCAQCLYQRSVCLCLLWEKFRTRDRLTVQTYRFRDTEYRMLSILQCSGLIPWQQDNKVKKKQEDQCRIYILDPISNFTVLLEGFR